MSPIGPLVERFRDRFAARPTRISRAPGRVSLIGGHIDYNDGWVLPVAVEREVRVAFRPREDGRLRIHSTAFEETVELSLDDLPDRASGWPAYPIGVARTLLEAGFALRGLDATIAADLPMGAGLGSSAALEVAFAAALRDVAALDLPDARLARLCQRAENEYVGVRCGIMDQLASACARPGHALLIDCVTLETRDIPLPDGVSIVVFDTGVARELRSSEFNRRREQCREALRRLSEEGPPVRTYRDLRPDGLERRLASLPPPLRGRARHVVTEIARVLEAADAIGSGEIARAGALMFASHRSSRDDYESSCPELDALVELAERAGAIGARLTGAGFGGCTVNLIRTPHLETFSSVVTAGYRDRFGRGPAYFHSGAAAGASVSAIDAGSDRERQS